MSNEGLVQTLDPALLPPLAPRYRQGSFTTRHAFRFFADNSMTKEHRLRQRYKLQLSQQDEVLTRLTHTQQTRQTLKQLLAHQLKMTKVQRTIQRVLTRIDSQQCKAAISIQKCVRGMLVRRTHRQTITQLKQSSCNAMVHSLVQTCFNLEKKDLVRHCLTIQATVRRFFAVEVKEENKFQRSAEWRVHREKARYLKRSAFNEIGRPLAREVPQRIRWHSFGTWWAKNRLNFKVMHRHSMKSSESDLGLSDFSSDTSFGESPQGPGTPVSPPSNTPTPPPPVRKLPAHPHYVKYTENFKHKIEKKPRVKKHLMKKSGRHPLNKVHEVKRRKTRDIQVNPLKETDNSKNLRGNTRTEESSEWSCASDEYKAPVFHTNTVMQALPEQHALMLRYAPKLK